MMNEITSYLLPLTDVTDSVRTKNQNRFAAENGVSKNKRFMIECDLNPSIENTTKLGSISSVYNVPRSVRSN